MPGGGGTASASDLAVRAKRRSAARAAILPVKRPNSFGGRNPYSNWSGLSRETAADPVRATKTG